jgi:preprotein translocase subunit SecD
MKFRIGRFNLYLLASIAAALAACQTTGPGSVQSGKTDLATVRIHLETHADPIAGTSKQITVGREQPQALYVSGAMLGEPNLASAQLWDGNEGEYAIHLQFDRDGARTLETLSMSYRGKRLAILSQFPEPRWIGTFRMDRRIADGTILFRPDATREEAQRIVSGLNKAVAKLKKYKD